MRRPHGGRQLATILLKSGRLLEEGVVRLLEAIASWVRLLVFKLPVLADERASLECDFGGVEQFAWSLNWPGPHAEHDEAPSLENFPAAHAIQDGEPASA